MGGVGDSRSEERERLVGEHWATVYAFARRLLGSPHDAEDVAQQTFFQAFAALERFEGRSAVRTWLLRIAVRVAARVLAGRERAPGALDGNAPAASADDAPDAPLIDGERAEAVRRAVESLAPAHRLVLTLFTVEGLSHAEIAAVLECPEGTVWSRLFHAKRALARRLDPQLLEEER